LLLLMPAIDCSGTIVFAPRLFLPALHANKAKNVEPLDQE
jgi:hypothetical protein